MTEQDIKNITLKRGDVLCEIDVLDKLGELTTLDIAKSKAIGKVVKISDKTEYDEEHTIELGDYLLVPKFHQITDKMFITPCGKEFLIINEQDILLNLKLAK